MQGKVRILFNAREGDWKALQVDSEQAKQPGIQAGVNAPQKVFQVDLRCQYSYSYPIHYSHYYEPLHQLQIWIRARLGNSPALTNDQACAIQRSIVNIQGPQKGFWKGTLSSVSLSCHSPVSLSGVAIWCRYLVSLTISMSSVILVTLTALKLFL